MSGLEVVLLFVSCVLVGLGLAAGILVIGFGIRVRLELPAGQQDITEGVVRNAELNPDSLLVWYKRSAEKTQEENEQNTKKEAESTGSQPPGLRNEAGTDTPEVEQGDRWGCAGTGGG